MISPLMQRLPPQLDAQQQAVVSHVDGPLLVIAGPGTGKTRSIVSRAINLLLLGLVVPSELVLCTFSRRAAHELRQRFDAAAQAVHYAGDPSAVRVATMHGLCHRIMSRRPESVGLKPGFTLLDKWEQLDLLGASFHRIFGPDLDCLQQQGWRTTRYIATRAGRYFERIAEETVDPAVLADSDNPFHAALGRCCRRYEAVLREQGALDLARLQVKALALLGDEVIAHNVGSGIRHIMVDEYQDTSHLQGQILFNLSRFHDNLCVVGDDDQSLYRFRGASVRNLLEFPTRFPHAEVRQLTVNYRSHAGIVAAYDGWMPCADWTNAETGGVPFRFAKTIRPCDPDSHADYPSVVRVSGTAPEHEADQLADLLGLLKVHQVIARYGDVALLLHSVKQRACRHYVAGLARAGIPYHVAPAASRPDDAAALELRRSDLPGLGFPEDKVCITTIHQAKGLEWPVVVVGSLNGPAGDDAVGRELEAYSPLARCEPIDRIAEFDAMRQFYTAFSRPQHLLVLTAAGSPARRFAAIWDGLPHWTSVDDPPLDRLFRRRFTLRTPASPLPPTDLIINRVKRLVVRSAE